MTARKAEIHQRGDVSTKYKSKIALVFKSCRQKREEKTFLTLVRSLLGVAQEDVTTSPSNTLQFVSHPETASDRQSQLNHNRAIGPKYFENHFL